MGGDPPLLCRVPDRDLPGPGEQGRLNRRGVPRAPRGDVVGPAALPVDGLVPEDRVADEAVGPSAIKQAAELALGAVLVEAPPDDRVKAGVPVPLPWVVTRARTRVAVGDAVPLALDPARAQRLLGESHDAVADLGLDDQR